jgi:hypothetical protein
MRVLTPIKAIRAKCMDCTCNQPKEIRECTVTRCALWPYRMGRRPKAEELIILEQKGAPSDAAVSVG